MRGKASRAKESKILYLRPNLRNKNLSMLNINLNKDLKLPVNKALSVVIVLKVETQ